MTFAPNALNTLRTATAAAVMAVALAACGGGGGASGTDASATDALRASSTTVPGTTASSSTTGSSSTTASEGPAGQDAAQYSLTFNDDFNGFDGNVWNDKIWYENGPDTKNYEVEDGKLKIWPQRDSSGNFFNRTIDTDGKYYQTYGYFEVEAKLPVGKGTWPAFWLFNHIDNRRPEIDIMEAYAGGGPSSGWSDDALHPTAYGATIWRDQNVNGGFQMVATPDLSAGFHKYGLKWEADRLTFYFDGREVYTQAVTMADPMYLMLDLWYGSASGQADASTPTGKDNSYEVNYVRAWQFK